MNKYLTNKVQGVVKGLLPFYLFTFLPFSVAAQKLVVEKAVVDVGRTGYENPITAVFEFRNKGSRRMIIDAVKPDCYCVTVDYPKGEIGGNEKFQIRMTYDARQLGHFTNISRLRNTGSS